MILIPLTKKELENIFDLTSTKIINYFLFKTILLQPEIKENQKYLPIQIPKEHIEQWFVQALGCTSVGAGSNPIDIVGDNFVADVKMLSCKVDENGMLKKSLSGETSIAQKFKGAGISLDDLFNNGDYKKILESWKSILIDKYDPIHIKYPNKNLYYFIFLRAKSTFYLCGLKMYHSNLKKASVNFNRTNNKNVYIDNFIDNQYGEVKIYKSKKRMELRLFPYHWKQENNVIEYNIDNIINKIDLRELTINNKLDEYIKSIFNNIINDFN